MFLCIILALIFLLFCSTEARTQSPEHPDKHCAGALIFLRQNFSVEPRLASNSRSSGYSLLSARVRASPGTNYHIHHKLPTLFWGRVSLCSQGDLVSNSFSLSRLSTGVRGWVSTSNLELLESLCSRSLKGFISGFFILIYSSLMSWTSLCICLFGDSVSLAQAAPSLSSAVVCGHALPRPAAPSQLNITEKARVCLKRNEVQRANTPWGVTWTNL